MPRQLHSVTACMVMSLVILCARPVLAQHSCGAIQVAAGSTNGEPGEDPWEFVGAGSVRFRLRGRVDVEPEVAISGGRFPFWSIIPSVSYSFGRPESPVLFYVIGGIGYFRETDRSIGYETAGMAWNGGTGVRVRLTQRLFIAPDLRIIIGPDVYRVTVGLGYRF